MIALDEDALICDFAETYHIYSIYDMPCAFVATLANGLREDSRIKMKANNLRIDIKTILLAHLVDNTAINVWMKSEDAQHNRNRPKSIVGLLLHHEIEDETMKFESGEDFITMWRQINGN